MCMGAFVGVEVSCRESFHHALPYIWQKCSSLDQSSLLGLLCPASLLPACPGSAWRVLRLPVGHHAHQTFMWELRLWYVALVLVWQELYMPSHGPAPGAELLSTNGSSWHWTSIAANLSFPINHTWSLRFGQFWEIIPFFLLGTQKLTMCSLDQKYNIFTGKINVPLGCF